VPPHLEGIVGNDDPLEESGFHGFKNAMKSMPVRDPKGSFIVT
jgi:hypothetical protein